MGRNESFAKKVRKVALSRQWPKHASTVQWDRRFSNRTGESRSTQRQPDPVLAHSTALAGTRSFVLPARFSLCFVLRRHLIVPGSAKTGELQRGVFAMAAVPDDASCYAIL